MEQSQFSETYNRLTSQNLLSLLLKLKVYFHVDKVLMDHVLNQLNQAHYVIKTDFSLILSSTYTLILLSIHAAPFCSTNLLSPPLWLDHPNNKEEISII
jgi:hypothetical protein